jgi:ADP-ribosylglycohydrolase
MAAALAETEPAPLLQVNDAEPLPRVAVAAAFEFADSFAVERAAESVTVVTHPAAAVLDAARIFAACIACAVQGEPASALPEPPPSQVALRDVSGGATALGTLQRIVSAVRETETFKDAVLLVVNAGGNADVAGAAAGALAGALYGADGIPERWLAALVDRQDIEICADRLLMAALKRMIADPVDRTA